MLVTGGTGYLGRALLPALVDRGHRVRALVRPGSESKLPAGAEARLGQPLEAASVVAALDGIDTVVHLIGVPKPSPVKARLFREIDLVSIQATVSAIADVNESCRPHLVYVSVAQPAPIMRDYVAVRAEGEALIRSKGLDTTCVRPWYVLGPGHRWPCVLMPIYAVLRLLPSTRASAERLGFVTLPQITRTLVNAVENQARGMRIVDVPQIRRIGIGD